MASSSFSLPFPEALPPVASSSFRSRGASALKQGIKTGFAGTIAYAIYAGWHLPQGYWAVFTALVVTQVNLGASWKAALYRTIGSTSGAVAAAVMLLLLGSGPVRAGVVLFVLATLFGFLTALHSSFSAAGFTTAIILVFGTIYEPWHMAWLRVLYTLLGAFVAFAVGVMIWPVRAREGLRLKLASILEGTAALYRAVTEAAMQGVNQDQRVRQLSRQLHDLRRGITQQMEEARSELAFSRFNQSAYQEFIDGTDQIRRRLTAMAEDSDLYLHAQVQPQLVPSLPPLTEQTLGAFAALAAAVRAQGNPADCGDLGTAVHELEVDVARLRQRAATAPFALDRMLPFWSFVFNLKEMAQDLKRLESTAARLA